MIDTTLINADQIVADQVISRIEGTDIIEQHAYIKHCFDETERNAKSLLEDYPITGNYYPPITAQDANYPLNHLPEIIDVKMTQAISGINKYDPNNQLQNAYKSATLKYMQETSNSKTYFKGKGSISKQNDYLRPHAIDFLEEIANLANIGSNLFRKT